LGKLITVINKAIDTGRFMSNLLGLVEEFQQLMNQITILAGETQAQVQQIPNVSMAEAPTKVNAVFEMCAEGNKAFVQASAKAEEIQKLLGR
jgi:hypothetical protein